MYTDFFELEQPPFSIAPDPRYVYLSERHREALAHLLYGLDAGGGFVLLTGEIGAGKTTICRLFLEQIPARCNVAYIFNPRLSVTELLQSICEEFRISVPLATDRPPGNKDYIDALNGYLLARHGDHQNSILIIDEAQNLSVDVLEQLRLLTNLETNERKLLQIILIGQPELREMLARPGLEQLAQRVIARFHLDRLSPAETDHYIAHRLAVAGLRVPLPFTHGALRCIRRAASGIPRRINLLCDRALLGAYSTGRRQVSSRIVKQAVREVFPSDRSSRPARPLPAFAGASAAALCAFVAILLLGDNAWQPVPSLNAVASTVRDKLLPLAPPAQPPQAQSAVETAQVPQQAKTASDSPPQSEPPSVSAARPHPETEPAPQASESATPSQGAPTGEENASVSLTTATQSASAAPSAGVVPTQPGLEAREIANAYRALAVLWNRDLGEQASCDAARRQGLRCFSGSGGLTEIRQLGRPVMLHLHDDLNQPYYALLTGLGTDQAFLKIGELRYAVSLAALAKRWRGRFETLWTGPDGYRREIRPGDRGPLVEWLSAQMTKADGQERRAGSNVFDDALRERLRIFQLSQGLLPDGIAGPQTLMRLATATDASEPRLENRELPAVAPALP